MKLIIPMAGRGTRVRPHSHVTPKPLLNVKGKSIVERIVDTFNRVLPQPVDEAVFILGPDFGEDIRDQLRQICDRHEMQAHFTVQEQALGTAHAVLCAGDHLEGEGISVFADTLFDMEANVDYEGADVIAWVKHVDDPSRFGVAVREGDRVVAFVEKPKELISNEALIGIYYIRDLAGVRREIKQLIADDARGPGGEFFLTDVFDRMLKAGRVFKTAAVSEWLDCGTIPALLDTTKRILENEPGDLLQGEVADSQVLPPVDLGPGAQVRRSVVGPTVSIVAGAVVEDSVVRDSIVFARARVRNVVLQDSLVGQLAVLEGRPATFNIGDHSEVQV
jgi:glucose-1-phosphate thymidylyltransferase